MAREPRLFRPTGTASEGGGAWGFPVAGEGSGIEGVQGDIVGLDELDHRGRAARRGLDELDHRKQARPPERLQVWGGRDLNP
jgi:hypothetical protein